ncbi:MAG: hypothetical protein HN348_20380 [Proteobacteria bacterium]|jgi:hypothetical protein|nr:hypothetical protein [Pseudomonadota bacterium]
MRKLGWLTIAPLVIALTACDMLLGPSDGPELVAAADSTLKSGDLPGASAEYAQLAKDNPDSVFVAIGRSYTLLLEGNYESADSVLAAVEEKAGDKLGEIKLRRALVALQDADLDLVKKHGIASGTAEGKLLAAEVHLVDLESDEASALLKEVSSTGGAVGQTAKTYLQMLESGDQIQAGLAEATALWALGERESACESSEELVKALETEDKNEQLILWAGRAVTSNKPGVASSLLDDIYFPDQELQWRIKATRAMVNIAEGETDEGVKLLTALAEHGDAPADGLYDALATAAALSGDKETAKSIVSIAGDTESAAIARGLLEAGAPRMAQGKAPPGSLKTYLENQ